jgi:NAD(P)-dependent dehydrogenase (short-subunit alcohol dehydrogenase family)
MGLLEGKRALVTGGTTGLGLGIAERFLAEGAQVVITGRDHDLGGRAELSLGSGARFIAADAADPDAVAESVSAAADYLGGLDVLVNNAGVGVTARLIETPLADYDRVMSVNVRGYLLYAQHAYPHLARRLSAPRCRRSAGSARPAMSLPRRCSMPARMPSSSPGRRCW